MKLPKRVTEKNLPHLIDRLGEIAAETAELNEEYNAIKKLLLDNDIRSGDGEMFSMTIARQMRSSVDTKAMYKFIGFSPSEELMDRFRTYTPTDVLKVTARKEQ